MADYCDDNRFELINKYKQKLIDGTNIETAPDEMAVIDDILFRFWQMGWLDKLERPEQRWIPCSERLPNDEKSIYLVCTNTGHQCQCRWTNVIPILTNATTEWHWNIFDIPQYSKVIAWMPLPPVYQGE